MCIAEDWYFINFFETNCFMPIAMDKKIKNWLTLILLHAIIENSKGCYCDHYPWTPWSSCSQTCNFGIQSRYRQIQVDDYYNKNFCQRLCTTQESRACNQQMCPINCQLGDLGPWSECDPCVKNQFRIRSLIQPSQFGGQPCSEQLVESRRCFPTKLCNIEEVNCENKFQCDNGRCISQNLECNGGNDCEDNSDERNCRRIRPLCNRRHESLPGVQLMSHGFHLLAGENRGEVLSSSFNGGKCTLVKSNDTRKTFRVPANLETVSFQVENEEDDVASDFYNDLISLDSATSSHSSSSSSGRGSSGIPLLFSKKRKVRITSSASFREAIQASYKKNSNFIRIHKVIAVSNFTMKQSDLQLSGVFLKALNSLPLEYNYALYSRIFDDFGTHYYTSGSMGGTYDLLYQYSAEELKTSGLTQEEMKECVRTETTRRVLFRKKKKVHTRCTNNEMTARHEGSFLQSSEKSISLVKGGRSEYAAALAWEKRGVLPEHVTYMNWLESTKENPVVIDFELGLILDLVKNFPCAATKRRNLRRALIEYMERFDPCQCKPCPNNGRPILSGTECLCVCQAGTYGNNCELRAPDYTSVSVDGYWSCWSTWSSCDASHKRRRTRICNNPSPLNGGKPCEGEQEQEEECHFSIFADRGALCISDDEAKKESDLLVHQPELGCLKPDPPEYGFIRNEKNHYAVGEVAEVVCLSGYSLVGYPFFRCLSDQTWVQRPVECRLSACPRPSTSQDVSISPFKSEYNIGETIQLRCPATFELNGHMQYTCGKGPSWKPPILRRLTCERADYIQDQGSCSPGQKLAVSQCVCMSPTEDCGHYSEDVCVLEPASEQTLTKPSCQFLAEKCLREHSFHFLHSGPCHSDVDLSWAIERVKISTGSIKKEPCGYNVCYDWEKCSESHWECFCLLPNQCPRGNEEQVFCIQIRSRKMTANLCMLGTMKCSKRNFEVLHEGSCLE
ncbi:complement component C6 isoform X2 [Sceloporus undulatus]|uniref:complement component C6 isoform X2 n=1 Tax=Sceloporus undulatus TaxID=8520 RepID=UPI001C4C25E2|nr:complement component C6 isoform X2 [Sceloporus undulatus]